MSLLRSSYYGLAWIGAPFVLSYLRWRTLRGLEDKDRIRERIGVSKEIRPAKPLLWVHAVSVGESVAAFTVIEAILKKYPEIHVLLTTTTLSSAKVVKKRLFKNMTHQFCPVDTPQAVHRFLDYWQPDLAVWIESELWPNLLHETQMRGIPTVLLNARMSSKSFSNWKKLKGIISPLLERLSLCAVQTEKQASIFQTLGAKTISVMGNVKGMMTPLVADEVKYHALKEEIGGRSVWLAASTHPGEEEIILKTHKILRKDIPNLLTIIVPRHIERASTLQSLVSKEGLTSALRTDVTSLKGVEIYIGNTLGEMGLFYALSSLVLMGATFVPKGGHNPIEAAQMGAFVIHGPHIFNNPQLYEILATLGLSKQVQDENELPFLVRSRLKKQKEGYDEPFSLRSYREKGLINLMKLLTPHLATLREER
ncbi:MAG: 3-deoxy-D-manno-octulosonic acid transferase [Alphaproteobacteria bacterium]|nr:3-deoxy-D-manno-octulosonic acid transferase [Alphaproteobacteria bacterium]